jgi:hypothetical protein
MGGVIRFERPTASSAVTTKLVELGFLQAGARHRANAVKRAIDRLRRDLIRDGVICDGDLSRSPSDEGQKGSRSRELDQLALADGISTK